jgi:hypothetical protein
MKSHSYSKVLMKNIQRTLDRLHNKRVVSSVGWWSLPEPTGSGFGLFVLRRNPSDSAAHAKHYV